MQWDPNAGAEMNWDISTPTGMSWGASSAATGMNLDVSAQSVERQCSYTAKNLPAQVNIVTCPPGCLTQKENVWGSDIYAENSSICAAGIHAGQITNQGGKLIAQKKPGQGNYASSSRNGIKAKHCGPSPGSFVFISSSEFESTLYKVTSDQLPQTGMSWGASSAATGMKWNGASSAGMNWGVTSPAGMKWDRKSVSAGCSTKAKELPTQTTLVICPDRCLTQNAHVWGHDAYADESSVCRAAIHAGKIPKEGGSVVVVKRSGEAFYRESSRNGVTTKSRGPSTGSFVFGSMSDFQFSALNFGNSEPSFQTTGYFSSWR